MPISGLILTLQDPAAAAGLVEEFHRRERQLELGELHGNYLPAVLETKTPHESREVHDRLLDWPGIVGVDVVFVSTDDMVDTIAPCDVPEAKATHT
jgi:hypothetical protein